MPDYFLVIVVLLFVLAISDLIVGVSNDAVNFLNSAIGSKVATRKTIMIVASLGIFIGATFSSGMMEVARKGIFNPEFFLFSEVMVIFLAVMMTDIFLLDLFNTYGMPTSTTVSIVFELLGAAVAVALLKVVTGGEGLSAVGNYINSSSALTIIIGIFASVAIAFLIGAILQYLSRLLFSFQYQKRMKWVGGIWSGLALTFLTYFLFFKGLKGASFVSSEVVAWINSHIVMLLSGALIFWSILMQSLHVFFRVNILRVIVLFGTFSLAMAFAGNDLVNFIGVPIAGFESFRTWSGSGVAAQELTMESLAQPVQTETYLLLLAGGIMIVTLWLSSKAKSVTETEVNLGRQDEGTETFSPNVLAQIIVRYSRVVSKGVHGLVPQAWLNKAEQSFRPLDLNKENPAEKPAFDLVRASVNLTAASMLISLATSLKLPLSTTYVSFMVAMGASLADRAWGRNSAVYRVAGVLNVIGGWFFTAIIAFVVAGIAAFLIAVFQGFAIVALLGILLFLIIRSFSLHKKREQVKNRLKTFESQNGKILSSKLTVDTAEKVGAHLQFIAKLYKDAMTGLLDEDLEKLTRAKKDLKTLKAQNEELKNKLFQSIKRLEGKGTEAGRLYLLVYDLEQDILQSTALIVKACRNHVENSLEPLSKIQTEKMRQLIVRVHDYLVLVAERMQKQEFEFIQDILEQKQMLFMELEKQISEQIVGIREKSFGRRNSMLVFSLKLETKDLLAVAARFVKLYHRTSVSKNQKEMMLVGEGELKQAM